MKKRHMTLFTAFAAAAAFASTAQAAVIDIGNTGQTVLSGASAWTIANNTNAAPSTTFTVSSTTITATLSEITGDKAQTLNTSVGGSTALNNDMYLNGNDFSDTAIGNNGPNGTTLTLSGLLAGDYNWTGWHGNQDKNSARGVFDILVGATVKANAVQMADSTVNTFAGGFGMSSFTFTSTGADVVINIQKDASSSGVSASTEFYLNGFEITAVPEPTSLSLLALGGLALLRRRRA